MADQRLDVVALLDDLAPRLEWPTGEAGTEAALEHIRGGRARRPTWPVPRWLAAAAVAVAVLAVALALPGPRHAVARFLGIGAVRVREAPPTGQLGAPLRLGRLVPVE